MAEAKDKIVSAFENWDTRVLAQLKPAEVKNWLNARLANIDLGVPAGEVCCYIRGITSLIEWVFGQENIGVQTPPFATKLFLPKSTSVGVSSSAYALSGMMVGFLEWLLIKVLFGFQEWVLVKALFGFGKGIFVNEPYSSSLLEIARALDVLENTTDAEHHLNLVGDFLRAIEPHYTYDIQNNLWTKRSEPPEGIPASVWNRCLDKFSGDAAGISIFLDFVITLLRNVEWLNGYAGNENLKTTDADRAWASLFSAVTKYLRIRYGEAGVELAASMTLQLLTWDWYANFLAMKWMWSVSTEWTDLLQRIRWQSPRDLNTLQRGDETVQNGDLFKHWEWLQGITNWIVTNFELEVERKYPDMEWDYFNLYFFVLNRTYRRAWFEFIAEATAVVVQSFNEKTQFWSIDLFAMLSDLVAITLNAALVQIFSWFMDNTKDLFEWPKQYQEIRMKLLGTGVGVVGLFGEHTKDIDWINKAIYAADSFLVYAALGEHAFGNPGVYANLLGQAIGIFKLNVSPEIEMRLTGVFDFTAIFYQVFKNFLLESVRTASILGFEEPKFGDMVLANYRADTTANMQELFQSEDLLQTFGGAVLNASPTELGLLFARLTPGARMRLVPLLSKMVAQQLHLYLGEVTSTMQFYSMMGLPIDNVDAAVRKAFEQAYNEVLEEVSGGQYHESVVRAFKENRDALFVLLAAALPPVEAPIKTASGFAKACPKIMKLPFLDEVVTGLSFIANLPYALPLALGGAFVELVSQQKGYMAGLVKPDSTWDEKVLEDSFQDFLKNALEFFEAVDNFIEALLNILGLISPVALDMVAGLYPKFIECLKQGMQQRIVEI